MLPIYNLTKPLKHRHDESKMRSNTTAWLKHFLSKKLHYLNYHKKCKMSVGVSLFTILYICMVIVVAALYYMVKTDISFICI